MKLSRLAKAHEGGARQYLIIGTAEVSRLEKAAGGRSLWRNSPGDAGRGGAAVRI